MRISPRVIVLPLVVVLFALGLSWWSARQADAATARIRTDVTEWCALAARGENPAARIPAPTFLSRPLGAALVETCRDASDRIRVEAAPGPAPGRHAVKSTHYAEIMRDGAVAVGISFLADGDRLTVVGYWKE